MINNCYLGSHVQSLCDALDIPHLEARIDIDNGYKVTIYIYFSIKNIKNSN